MADPSDPGEEGWDRRQEATGQADRSTEPSGRETMGSKGTRGEMKELEKPCEGVPENLAPQVLNHLLWSVPTTTGQEHGGSAPSAKMASSVVFLPPLGPSMPSFSSREPAALCLPADQDRDQACVVRPTRSQL